MKTLNLGILAHVDAGKTSLTERLLYTTGVIDDIGSVDAGNTQTDSLQLERQRGITIKSAVASFVVGDTRINLIDTPGHPDFIAEVERVLNVLDGVVLVVSAVEGVQAQTRVLFRALQRLNIPTIFFVNKIDRRGAQYDGVLKQIAEKLAPDVAPMGSIQGASLPSARFIPFKEVGKVKHPVFFGSAITGAGIGPLLTGITKLLPAAQGDPDAPISGIVFKIERGAKHDKIAYVRMFAGAIRARQQVKFGDGKSGKVTAIHVFDQGKTIQRTSVVAGEIGKLWGLADIQIDDSIGETQGDSRSHFAQPTLETVITARNPAQKGALFTALTQLAEQDPLINLRQDNTRNELFVSLYGEVQKEVIQATLANDFGIEVGFQNTRLICVERPVGTGNAVQLLQEEANPTSATIGLRVEPGPVGSGVAFRLNVNPRLRPVYIYKTTGNFIEHMRQYVLDTLKEGLFGWQVTDCIVTMYECNYYVGDGPTKPFSDTPRTTAADYRKLTPLVLRAALQQAGTVVCEPILHFRLEIPEASLATVLPVLAKLRATTQTTDKQGSAYVLEGNVPAAQVNTLQQQLPALTSGEGMLEYELSGYMPLRG